jgi:hypothetical protein
MTTIIQDTDSRSFTCRIKKIAWWSQIHFMQNITDTQLRELAKKRVDFRRHLIVYFVVNASLWIIWYFTGAGYIWPVWPMVGWGVGVVFHYMFDYRSSTLLSEDNEFNRLKEKYEKHHAM